MKKKSLWTSFAHAPLCVRKIGVVCGILALSSNLSAQKNLMTDSIYGLSEVEIIANRPKHVEVTKLEVPLSFLPVSVSTISAEKWDLKGLTNIEDVVKFLPGAHARTVYGAYQRLSVRGFDITPIMIDGVKDERYVPPGSSAPFPDFASVESIELVKGPASVLHGQFAVGGVLNVTRKAPTQKKVFNTRIMLGSYNNRQASFDFGGPLSSNVSTRAIVNFSNVEGYRYTNDKRLSAYFALDWKITDKQKLDLRAGFNDDSYGTDVGLPRNMADDIYNIDGTPYLKKGEFLRGLDRRARYNSESDRYINQGHNISLKYKNKISPLVNITNTLTYTGDYMNYLSTEPIPYLESENPIYKHYYLKKDKDGVLQKQYISLDSVILSGPLKFGNRSTLISNQLEVGGKLSFGKMKNDYLLGYTFVSFYRDSYKGYKKGEDVYGPGYKSKVPVKNPQSMGHISSKFSLVAPSHFFTHAVFLQNILDISPQFKLMLAGRYDFIEFNRVLVDSPILDGKHKYKGREPYATIRNQALTYRAGLVYLPIEGLSVYTSVANFFQPYRDFQSNKVIYLDTDGKEFDPTGKKELWKPQVGYQAEIGARYSLSSNLYLAGSAYYIKRENERKNLKVIDVAGEDKTVMGQFGTTISKGFELEATVMPIKDLSLSAGYTYTDATVSGIKKNDYLEIDPEEGRQLGYSPKNMFYSSGLYLFSKGPLKNIMLNYTMSYTSLMYNSLSQEVEFPAHFTIDAGAAYLFDSGVRIGLHSYNLTNELYSINSLGRQTIPMPGRTYMVSLSYKLN